MINNETQNKTKSQSNQLLQSQTLLKQSLIKLISLLQSISNKLNNCLPVPKSQSQQQQQILVSTNLQLQTIEAQNFTEQLANSVELIVDNIIRQISNYERILQCSQENLRKHIKNQIELKLYYQHLEDVIAQLKKQKTQDTHIIKNLKTEISGLREKQKYYMTLSNNNTRNNQQQCIGGSGSNFESKLDTITMIKNRLSLNGTGQFYNNYFTKKIDRERQTLQLRDKRQSLAHALKQLYDSPIQSKSKDKTKKSQNTKSKPKDKSKSKQKSKSQKQLTKSKSGKSISNSQIEQTNNHPHKNVKKHTDQIKDPFRSTHTRVSSRRNSKN